jgi:hypothetical protein
MPKAAFAVKRCHPRFSVSAEAEAILRDGTSVPAQVLELSSHGCYIDAVQPVSVGSELVLRISNGPSTCELLAKIIYLHLGHGFGICGMGVVFGEMATDQRSKIEEWLCQLGVSQSASSPS